MNRAACFLVFICFASAGSDPYPKNKNIDVLHYTFRLELNDTTDIIVGNCDVTVRFTSTTDKFVLNLTDRKKDGTGMRVFGITQSGKPVWFKHEDDNLNVFLTEPRQPGDTATYAISYSGIPEDGLVIGKNKFGDRTFFGDNWPDRGRHWLPAIDHPYDKAKVDFIVIAPDHYKVVATGELVEERERPQQRKETHWREKSDVPIKVITIGVARFSVQQSGLVGNIPVTTWVFPQNEKDGFNDFAVAPQVLTFLQDYIGTYPYEKLAHVQSKTRWGGLENVSNIFYFENSVNGRNEIEGLIAHETAHQWFGNSVTEADWHHVWLSEGFASYFAALYLGSAHGDDRLKTEMADYRKSVIEYAKKKETLIIDTGIRDIGQVLNTNTYQKAAWVLHMLRNKIGPENFQKGIRAYYQKFRDSNALTADFIQVMEETSQLNLKEFFDTWLFQKGHPHVSGTWSYDGKAVSIELKTNYRFHPGEMMEIELVYPDGTSTLIDQYSLSVSREGAMHLPSEVRPAKVILDPNVKLLFEGGIKEKP